MYSVGDKVFTTKKSLIHWSGHPGVIIAVHSNSTQFKVKFRRINKGEKSETVEYKFLTADEIMHATETCRLLYG